MSKYTVEDVQAAHDELLPLAEKLVDRFGQAQAFEILTTVAHALCPDGRTAAPQFVFAKRRAVLSVVGGTDHRNT